MDIVDKEKNRRLFTIFFGTRTVVDILWRTFEKIAKKKLKLKSQNPKKQTFECFQFSE